MKWIITSLKADTTTTTTIAFQSQSFLLLVELFFPPVSFCYSNIAIWAVFYVGFKRLQYTCIFAEMSLTFKTQLAWEEEKYTQFIFHTFEPCLRTLKMRFFSTSPSLSFSLLISCQYIKYCVHNVHRIYIAFSQSFSLLCVDYLFIYYDTGIVYIARALPVKVKKMTRACTLYKQHSKQTFGAHSVQRSTVQHTKSS